MGTPTLEMDSIPLLRRAEAREFTQHNLRGTRNQPTTIRHDRNYDNGYFRVDLWGVQIYN
jgi:hypothetical protein